MPLSTTVNAPTNWIVRLAPVRPPLPSTMTQTLARTTPVVAVSAVATRRVPVKRKPPFSPPLSVPRVHNAIGESQSHPPTTTKLKR